MADSDIEISPPMGVEERERLYYERVLKQNFYGSEYARDHWSADDTSHSLKARAVLKYLQPRSALDCGCSFGHLVGELRLRGVAACGIDFSEAFIAAARPEIRPYLRAGDISQLPYPDRSFDVLICSEVLEHLPLSVIDRVLPDFRRVCQGAMFVTTPSHGPNIEGRYGFPMDHVPEWAEDARLNRSFRCLPVFRANGLPHCGHITLATHRWWRDKFAQHRLNRAVPLEIDINYDPELGLAAWPFCIQ